ncbi:MAG: RsmB/NOP family class I SAM-dependent RNA methyltransferase, partial [Muribaculaceae bacterium]|nr:RsmB/NOP family class I SAM-dependent RNA methyltransferase [Muribaculaceae bacterium]
MSLPSGFIDMARDLLKDEAPSFLEAMECAPVVSVRMNPRKKGACFEGAEKVKWCENGFYLPERPVFTLDPLLHAGAYYVQDASSMIYYEATKRVLTMMGNPERVSVLDLCAAPGGKTTAIIDALPDGSRIVANEFVGKRAAILRENLSRWGFPGAVVTNRDSAAFARDGSRFDIVAVDAPCSGEGMMRKDETARTQWSPQLVEECARLQREILSNAVETVRPGGYLLYSTCTFNRRENEENVKFVVENLGMKPVDLNFPDEWGIPGGIDTPYPATVSYTQLTLPTNQQQKNSQNTKTKKKKKKK